MMFLVGFKFDFYRNFQHSMSHGEVGIFRMFTRDVCYPVLAFITYCEEVNLDVLRPSVIAPLRKVLYFISMCVWVGRGGLRMCSLILCCFLILCYNFRHPLFV